MKDDFEKELGTSAEEEAAAQEALPLGLQSEIQRTFNYPLQIYLNLRQFL